MPAYEENMTTNTRSGIAGADLSGNQYYAVKLDTTAADGRVVLAGEGDKAIGILQDKPAAAGRACSYAFGGTSKAVAGASITAGDRVVQNSTGRLVSVGSGDDWSLGVAQQSAAIGEIFPMHIQPTGPTV
jgi:hypothetical protein